MIDAFLVVRVLIRKANRQFLVGNPIKQTKLLFAKIDVFAPVERNRTPNGLFNAICRLTSSPIGAGPNPDGGKFVVAWQSVQVIL